MLDDRSIMSTLREAMARARHREGVPMLVALVDERGAMPETVDPGLRAEGAAIAARVDAIRATAAPTMRDGDNGGVVSALAVAAHTLLASEDQR